MVDAIKYSHSISIRNVVDVFTANRVMGADAGMDPAEGPEGGGRKRGDLIKDNF